jgi:hypothetical protein
MTQMGMSVEELNNWRDHPVTKAALVWLAFRMKTYQENIPLYIVNDKIADARAAAGALQGYTEVLAAFTEKPEETVEVPEEPFIDPATRPSTRTTK